MSTIAQNMQNGSPRSNPAPADTNLPTNENLTGANTVIKEHVVSIEGGLAKDMSSTLEQIRDEVEPNNANGNPMMSIEASLANMSDTLGQILDVLKGSTIAEERGKDDSSRFWATYKKVSTEYDDDFLGRANDDMGIILTFAGLFSAVNSTFIVGMQPNTGDTTNALLLYLIQISVNGPNSVPDISTLSSSTVFSSLTVWMQTLAYGSLALSLLAAFGAVLGKQWLHSYKAAQGRGTLEERGIERQMKLDGVEYFFLQTILRAFLVLLQISLLLFGLSLSANMWAEQTTISSVIISSTAFGILFYAGTVLVSALRPDSPFQTPGSDLFVAICQKILPDKFTFTRNIFAKSSAIRWILETSTNPEFVEAAAAMIPYVQWPPKLDASAAFARLRDNFMACRDKDELHVKYRRSMAHLCIQSVKINKKLLEFDCDDKFQSTRSHFIRDAFMAGRDAYNQIKDSNEGEARQKYRADTRTALRTMVVHGRSCQLSRPDDKNLIWNGDLYWCLSNNKRNFEDFDWLIDLAGDPNTADETRGDALLALSAMQGLGSPTKRRSFISMLISYMGSTPPRVRHTALRAVFEAREELASITSASMPEGIDAQFLDDLSRALLTVVHPNVDQAIHNASFHEDRDFCYIRLIYALTKNDEWYQRLTCDGHLDRCISLVDGVRLQRYSEVGFFLLVIFGRIKSSGNDLPFSPAEERWRLLITRTWDTVRRAGHDDYVDGLPALVTATRLNLTLSCDGVASPWLAMLAEKVNRALAKLQRRQHILVNDGLARVKVDTAIPHVQSLYDDLNRMVNQWNTSQQDDRISGS